MKKVLGLIFVTIMYIGFLSGCGNSSAETEPTASETDTQSTGVSASKEKVTDFKEYEIAGVSFEVPEIWETQNSSDDTMYFYQDTYNFMTVAVDDSSGESVTGEYRDLFIDEFMNNLKNAKLLSNDEISVDNKPALKFNISSLIDGDIYNSSVVAFDVENQIVYFMNASMKSVSVDYNEEFESILNSISTPKEVVPSE